MRKIVVSFVQWIIQYLGGQLGEDVVSDFLTEVLTRFVGRTHPKLDLMRGMVLDVLLASLGIYVVGYVLDVLGLQFLIGLDLVTFLGIILLAELVLLVLQTAITSFGTQKRVGAGLALPYLGMVLLSLVLKLSFAQESIALVLPILYQLLAAGFSFPPIGEAFSVLIMVMLFAGICFGMGRRVYAVKLDTTNIPLRETIVTGLQKLVAQSIFIPSSLLVIPLFACLAQVKELQAYLPLEQALIRARLVKKEWSYLEFRNPSLERRVPGYTYGLLLKDPYLFVFSLGKKVVLISFGSLDRLDDTKKLYWDLSKIGEIHARARIRWQFRLSELVADGIRVEEKLKVRITHSSPSVSFRPTFTLYPGQCPTGIEVRDYLGSLPYELVGDSQKSLVIKARSNVLREEEYNLIVLFSAVIPTEQTDSERVLTLAIGTQGFFERSSFRIIVESSLGLKVRFLTIQPELALNNGGVFKFAHMHPTAEKQIRIAVETT